MRVRFLRLVLLAVACATVGLPAGCAAVPPTRQDLTVPYQQAWEALDAVMAGRLTIVERDADRGRIVGTTPAERATVLAPGIGGHLLGLETAQTRRRRVLAHLKKIDDACRVDITAWIQYYDTAAAGTLSGLDRDPADVALYGTDPPGPPISTWIDDRRDPELEAALLQAVRDRLKPE